MINPTFKKIIGISVSVLILCVAYVGNFRPLVKSQTFIDTLRNLSSARSLSEFEKNVSVPLDYWSPIGQEELVRNIANAVLGIVQNNNDPKLLSEVVNYIEGYYKPIVDRGRGMSFEQNLYLLGAINEMAFTKTGDARYLRNSHEYYSEGLTLGPRRPQFLYGMFDIFRMEGNIKGATDIARQITTSWPTDTRTTAALDDFLVKIREVAASSSQKNK